MGKDRILVVDDDPDNRAMVSHFLATWGYSVEDANNGRIALEKAKASPPSLVLLDLEMPEMDGFETCERLRSDPETQWIPIIIFSGLEKMPSRIRGLQHGADDYVAKTVEPDELRTRIELVLERNKRYAALAARPIAPGAGESAAVENRAEVKEEKEDDALDTEVTVSVSLSSVPFPDAVRLVLTPGKSGVARVTEGDRSGEVHVHDGSIIHASVDGTQGSEAFYELALWRSGRFEFRDVNPGGEKTILTSTRSLLVEASRRLDAWSRISSKVKSFDSIPKLASLGVESIRLTSSDWAVLRLVDGRRSIRDIVDELRTDLFEAGRIVFSLLTVGALRLDDSPEPRDEALDLVVRRGDSVTVSEPFDLTALEWDLLSRADGSRTLGAIREAMNVPAPAFLKLARSLKEKGFLSLVAREDKKRKGA